MLQVLNLSKSYGTHLIFEEATFSLIARDHVGLVGRNGSGKTTLFRLITKEEAPDTGQLTAPREYQIACVSQHLKFQCDTVIQEACMGLPEKERDQHWHARKILFGLGFDEDKMTCSPLELSGGYQVRLNLAKVLVQKPNLLLLDEPTNYLDIVSLRWLERFLLAWPNEFILITHDRSFMDKVNNSTMGIHRGRIRKTTGKTTQYYDQIALQEEIHEKTRVNEEKKKKQMEQFVTRFRAKARLGGLVQSRVKMLEKQVIEDKLQAIKIMKFSFNEQPVRTRTIMNVRNISFGYDESEPNLIDKFSIDIGVNDRICVIGKNGKGKTTLLRVIAEDLQRSQGKIKPHADCLQSFFAQTNQEHLDPEKTVEDEILCVHPTGNRQQVRSICGAMLFEGDLAEKKVKVLSGGEKSRVMLGQVLAKPANLLLLDEPTNHLDMESNDSLLGALKKFDGAVMMVTHNEMFLHELANRLIVFQENKISIFEGTYQEFLDRIGWDDEKDLNDKDSENDGAGSLTKKELRQLRSEITKRKSKELYPINKKMEQLEKKIEKLEALNQEHQDKLLKAAESGDGSSISFHSQESHKVSEELEDVYLELEELMEKQEELSEKFEQEFSDLEERQ